MIQKATALSKSIENAAAGSVPTTHTKILHVISGEHFSGAERVQDLLAMALPEFGYEADFVCLKPEKFPKVRESKSELFEVPMGSNFDIFCYREVVRLVKKNGYVALHAHSPRTLLISALVSRAIKIPFFYHVHSPVSRDSTRSIQNRINTVVETWALKSTSGMICVSSSLAKYMRELGHPPEKIFVVSNGVPSIEDLPHRDPPKTPWTIGTMALFRPRKGTEVLLDALAILKNNGTEVRLRAVGPFETEQYEKEIMARVEKLDVGDRIDWTGFQKDVSEQFQQMDLFVLPSLFGEGLPMVVLEAMAHGVPVIASRVEGIPEAVRDGIDGLIFQPGNAKDLADKIRDIYGLRNRWKSMSESSITRQREQLSDRSMAMGLADVYDKILPN